MIWLNGTLRPAAGALDADDRGLLLGESVFETVLVENGRAQFWQAHLARLFAGCDAFGLARRYAEADLSAALHELVSHHGHAARQVLRITVTGGAGGRGLVPLKADVTANWLMQLSDTAPPPAYLRLVDSDVLRVAGNLSTAHKTTAYLDNILARRQALVAKADEALLFNQHGRLACAAAGTVFVQKGRQLITPPISEGALPGILRGAALAAAPLAGLDVLEGLVGRDLIAKADALYLSNSLWGLVPAGYEGDLMTAQKKQGDALRAALLSLG